MEPDCVCRHCTHVWTSDPEVHLNDTDCFRLDIPSSLLLPCKRCRADSSFSETDRSRRISSKISEYRISPPTQSEADTTQDQYALEGEDLLRLHIPDPFDVDRRFKFSAQ